jgi:hypothetical protein
MDDVQAAQAAALARCRFTPGSTAKRFVTWAHGLKSETPLTPQASAFLDKLAHQYRKQIGTCMSVTCTVCHVPPIDREEVRVALDALLEGRGLYSNLFPRWVKAALVLYNAAHKQRVAHLYEYATRVAPQSRRAATLGDLFCRICGEQLANQIKQPHQLVRGSADIRRHLMICALQLLSGMRKPAKPGYRSLPLEQMWRDDNEVPHG